MCVCVWGVWLCVRQSFMRKSDLCDKLKRGIFHAVAMSALLYRCTSLSLKQT